MKNAKALRIMADSLDAEENLYSSLQKEARNAWDKYHNEKAINEQLQKENDNLIKRIKNFTDFADSLLKTFGLKIGYLND